MIVSRGFLKKQKRQQLRHYSRVRRNIWLNVLRYAMCRVNLHRQITRRFHKEGSWQTSDLEFTGLSEAAKCFDAYSDDRFWLRAPELLYVSYGELFLVSSGTHRPPRPIWYAGISI